MKGCSVVKILSVGLNEELEVEKGEMSEYQFIFFYGCVAQSSTPEVQKESTFRTATSKKTRRAQQRDSNFYSIMMSLL